MSSLRFDLACGQTNFADGSLTCKKRATRSQRIKQQLAKQAAAKEFGGPYEPAISFADVTDPRAGA